MLFISQVKDFVWPIKRQELNLFLPISLMMFCLLFNFSSLRSMKDALVIPELGAEVISFMKLWVVLPCALVITLCYVKLSNRFTSEQMFYLVTTCFLSIFLIFSYAIYPNQELYHPSSEITSVLIEEYPHLKWFIKLASKWSYALIYVFAELWSVVVINLMFWQFVNHIVDTEKAKRLYPFIILIGNIGLVAAGNAVVYCTNSGNSLHLLLKDFSSSFASDTEITLKLLTIIISIIGIGAMVILRYMYVCVFKNMTEADLSHKPAETKTSLSMRESIKLLITSKYIGYILVMVICYGLVINIVEGPWKDSARALYPTTTEYMSFMGNFNIWMGTSCVIMTIFGGYLLRNFSWFLSALMTPSIIAITGTLFFIFVIWGDVLNNSLFESFNPLYAAVIAGAAQNILSKSTKYSLFDSTKEMAYIPLSVELRTKGKAAAEVVGAKMGKSLGAFVQSSVFILYPAATFSSIAPILMIVFLFVIAIWFLDLTRLNTEYKKLHDED